MGAWKAKASSSSPRVTDLWALSKKTFMMASVSGMMPLPKPNTKESGLTVSVKSGSANPPRATYLAMVSKTQLSP